MSRISDKQRLVAARQKARHFAVQALYQWKLGDDSWTNIAAQFLAQYDVPQASVEYFKELLSGVIDRAAELDALLEPHMGLKISELGPVELSILRLATFEMQTHLDVPYRVVINEAVNLAKKFAAQESYKYINAVLDKLAPQLRALETGKR